MVKYITWLEDIGKEALGVAGGKGAHLAELWKQQLPVPPAFVVTVEAYKKFIEANDLEKEIAEKLKSIDLEDTQQLEKTAKEIQEKIKIAEMPNEVREDVLQAYQKLGDGFVAVRSSATTEDLAEASFAGQQETFLNIKGNEKLTEAVKACWASLFTARAIYYRARRGFKKAEAYIAIIVQKMINADAAGVAFTCDPITNDRSKIVIEACFGLGEGVVSGATKPDRYVIDKDSLKILAKHISEKTFYFTRSKSGETVKLKVQPEWQGKPVLDEKTIKELTKLCKQIEAFYATPQDIEFAVEAGKVYILQTRPVTTLKKKIEAIPIEQAEVLLDGLGASPGLAFGTVVLVRTLDDLPKVKKDDILVTKMTTPDMVVTMQRARAIVTDEGGYTAHAAIVSRELGIPCVVGTLKATKVLKDGQLVTVDGTKGKVYKGVVKVKK